MTLFVLSFSYISELSTAVAERVAVAARAADMTADSAAMMYRRATRRIDDDIDRLVTDIRQRLDVQMRPTASVFYY